MDCVLLVCVSSSSPGLWLKMASLFPALWGAPPSAAGKSAHGRGSTVAGPASVGGSYTCEDILRECNTFIGHLAGLAVTLYTTRWLALGNLYYIVVRIALYVHVILYDSEVVSTLTQSYLNGPFCHWPIWDKV